MLPSGTSRVAVLQTIATAAFLHGVVTVGLPALVLRWTDGNPMLVAAVGPLRWLGVGLAGFGAYLYLWSAVRLLRSCTSAVPGAKPTVLVKDGWYGRTRHPLLLGVVAILLGEAVFFSSLALLAYALAYWAWLAAFVVVREEPDLRQAFGSAFEIYCRNVPRWIPRPRRPTGRR